MNIPTPKFAKGDKVFFATTYMTKHTVPCPDCDGSGKWPIKSPAGNDFTISCARCYSYCEPEMALSWPTFEGSVKELTIGSVRLDTESDTPISYMCHETGVGSGSVYNGRDFYADKETAQKAADGKAQAANLIREAVRTRALTALPHVHLTYENAVETAYVDRERKLYGRVRDLIYDIENIESVKEIPALIEKFKNSDGE